MTKKISPKKLLILAFMAIVIFGIIPKISLAQNSPPPQNPPTPPISPLPLPPLPPNPQPTPTPLPPANTNPQDLPDSPITCSITNPSGWAACAIYWVIRVIHWIMGLFISLGAVLVGFGLELSHGLVNQNMVQAGFSVSLSIANLGFVLAIIIVALATILRRDTYGIKQLLWKIIVAAVLVNFGLIIAGTILGFSDMMTSYFTAPFGYKSPGESGQFVNKLTAALSPNVFLVPPTENNNDKWCIHWLALSGVDIGLGEYAQCEAENAVVVAKAWDQFSQLILAMVFIIVADFIIALTLMALAVMLIIRYVTLGILLMIMPLAWLLWIFPQYSSHFKQWWQTFLKWAFFPTIVTFFLFLAVATVNNAGSSNSLPSGNQLSHTNSPPVAVTASRAVSTQTGERGFVPSLLQLIMVAGLSIGGLFAANKMGIAGASVAMGAAQSVGKGVKGYAARQSKKVGGAALQKVATKERLEAIGRSRIPGAGMIARGGLALQEKGRKAAMEAANKKASGLSADQNRMNLATYSPTTSMDKIMGTLSVLAKDPKELEKVKTIGGKDMKSFMRENEKDFINYNSGGLYKDIGESQMMTPEILAAEEKRDKAQKNLDKAEEKKITGPDREKLEEEWVAADDEFKKAWGNGLKKNPAAAAAFSMADPEVKTKAAAGKLPNGRTEEEYKSAREMTHLAASQVFTPNQFSNYIGNMKNDDEVKQYLKSLEGAINGKKAEAAKNPSIDPTDPSHYMTDQIANFLKESPQAAMIGLTPLLKRMNVNLEKIADRSSAPARENKPRQGPADIFSGGGENQIPQAKNFTIPDNPSE